MENPFSGAIFVMVQLYHKTSCKSNEEILYSLILLGVTKILSCF